MSEDWYQRIEEPLKNLVKLLRNNGFNTFCSCGHLPMPYIQMEMYEDAEMSRLYNLLTKNGYTNFVLVAHWDSFLKRRTLEIRFSYLSKLAEEADLK